MNGMTISVNSLLGVSNSTVMSRTCDSNNREKKTQLLTKQLHLTNLYQDFYESQLQYLALGTLFSHAGIWHLFQFKMC